MMEHRHYPRFPAALKAGIFNNRQFLGYFEIHDISRDGLALRIQKPMAERNDVFNLIFSLTGETFTQKGLVVHAEPEAVGVMFIDTINQALLHLLDSLPVSNSHESCAAPTLAYYEDRKPHQTNAGYIHNSKTYSGKAFAATKITLDYIQIFHPKGLLIRTGNRLDISAATLIKNVIEATHATSPQLIVIDMAETQDVFDSGIALLMLLATESGKFSERIHILNCNAKIVAQLYDSPISKSVHIACA